MMAEKHRADSEMGELQHAVLREMFEKIRDGDRFFYENQAEAERLELVQSETSAEVMYNYTLAAILELHGIEPVDQDGNTDDNIWFVGSTNAGKNARYGLFASSHDAGAGPQDDAAPKLSSAKRRDNLRTISRRTDAGSDAADASLTRSSSSIARGERHVPEETSFDGFTVARRDGALTSRASSDTSQDGGDE